MADIGFGLQGILRSTPSKVACKADDNFKIVYKEMGAKRMVPFMWTTRVASESGADVVVASGVQYFGYDLVDYASMSATVVSGTQDGNVYFNKDYDNNIITLKNSGSESVEVDIFWFLGEDPTI